MFRNELFDALWKNGKVSTKKEVKVPNIEDRFFNMFPKFQEKSKFLGLHSKEIFHFSAEKTVQKKSYSSQLTTLVCFEFGFLKRKI